MNKTELMIIEEDLERIFCVLFTPGRFRHLKAFATTYQDFAGIPTISKQQKAHIQRTVEKLLAFYQAKG